jgi:hypothetical protein
MSVHSLADKLPNVPAESGAEAGVQQSTGAAAWPRDLLGCVDLTNPLRREAGLIGLQMPASAGRGPF